MPPAPLHLCARILRALCLALTIAFLPVAALAQSNEILPLDQVRAGMQGYAYTIFAGDQVEKFDLEVIGVMANFLGPRQSIILVQLKGPKVERTGVVAGMSGSPVYLDGKLAGALSLKLGTFTKDPIAGVTPIADVIAGGSFNSPAMTASNGQLPSEATMRAGVQNGAALQSIETPLVFSGFQPAAIERFAPQLGTYGFVAGQAMIPMDLSMKTALGEKNLHFEMVNHPKLTPLLVAITAFNGLTQNIVYGEGTTLHMSGEIKLKGHPAVQLENTFAPGDTLNPDAMPIALTLMNDFMRIFTNTFEAPVVEKVSLKVESVAGRQSYTIDSAWLERGEAVPGER